MPPIIRLLQAIRNLPKSGAIKTIEDAYRLGKRELRERFNEYKKNIDDAFNQGKKEQTLDKRTKDIKKIDESGIKSLDEGKFVDDKGEFTEKSKDIFKKGIEGLDVKDAGKDKNFIDFVREQGDKEGADKLQKAEDEIKKAIEEANKRVADEKGLTDSPLDDLERIVKGEDPPTPTAKEMTERALELIAMKRKQAESVGSMSQEAMIRSALRDFLSRRLKDGTLTIPDAGDRDAIERFTQGADPIDIFRKAYGEDAIKGVSEIQDEYGDQLQRAGSFNELGDIFEKLFYRESGQGIYYNTTPKPVEDYGFDPGLMSLEEAERMLRKDLKEKQMLEDFDVTDREPNAAGGLAGILKL